jgi:subtilisin family serine protease
MGSKDARRGSSRPRSIELLEDRRVMSADPLSQLLGGSIQQHSIEEPPALVHHAAPDADFWIDSWSERDLDVLLGDLEQTLASAHGSTGLTTIRNDYGFIGTGQTVAIIDSGIAWNHTALGGGFGPNYRVVGGWDFTEENDANPYDDGPYGSHGTHVAGIVGADRAGTNDDGVAPGVDLVALRVFNDAGAGYFDWVENALRWVHQNRNAFANPITAVNLSLGTSWNSSSVPSWANLEDEFAQLKADGIFVAVSAGNSFASYNAPGLSYPAASSYVVPVMSVDDGGNLSSFSQRHTRAIGAPGRYIVSTVPDYVGNHNGVNDDYASYSGTSMAAPYIAGASVLLREAMQFVGYTNITQDTIYNHMMATATTFFDAATGQNYKRINLTNAFNALMPSDDYGSTAAAAYNLGSLSGTSQISGLIGKLSDADYFRFTAATTSSVAFTAATTHGLAPVWTASGGGGAVSGSRGETYTFEVVAGQSYTIGLSTSGGIGYYTLSVEAPYDFTYTDWGAITQLQVNNVSNAGDSWYRVQAGRTGYLTVEASYSVAGGNVSLALYNSNLGLVANSSATAGGRRVDLLANAGTEYFVRVTGANSDIDFRLMNLVSQSGTTVSVVGTSAADTFTFAVGAKHHTISINGTNYQFNRTAVSQANFSGGAGSDQITLTGSSGKETAVLRVGNASFTGSKFTLAATGIENVIVNSGGGKDTIQLYDSAGDDVYRAYPDYVVMSGAGYSHRANGFKTTTAYASTGNDTALVYGSSGKDVYRTYPGRVVMSGKGYSNTASGFDTTSGYAMAGVDKAYMYDSPGDDVYCAYADYVIMSGAGFENTASGFAKTYAYASSGNDVAHMVDSGVDDVYRSYSNRATMSGSGYYNYASGFGSTFSHLSAASDTATMYFSESHVDDHAWLSHVKPSGPAFSNIAAGFRQMFGGDTTSELERAWTDRSTPRNQPLDQSWGAYLSDNGTRNDVGGFDEITASLIDDNQNDDNSAAVDFLFSSMETFEPIGFIVA